jgi:hypothetical protein
MQCSHRHTPTAGKRMRDTEGAATTVGSLHFSLVTASRRSPMGRPPSRWLLFGGILLLLSLTTSFWDNDIRTKALSGKHSVRQTVNVTQPEGRPERTAMDAAKEVPNARRDRVEVAWIMSFGGSVSGSFNYYETECGVACIGIATRVQISLIVLVLICVAGHVVHNCKCGNGGQRDNCVQLRRRFRKSRTGAPRMEEWTVCAGSLQASPIPLRTY